MYVIAALEPSPVPSGAASSTMNDEQSNGQQTSMSPQNDWDEFEEVLSEVISRRHSEEVEMQELAAKEMGDEQAVAARLSFDQLNNDCLLEIFKYLDSKDIIKFERICRRWGSAIRSHNLELRLSDFNPLPYYERASVYRSVVTKFAVKRVSIDLLFGKKNTRG